MHLAADDIMTPALLLFSGGRRFGDERGLTNRGERIAQLVGERCQKLILAAVGLTQRRLRLLAAGDLGAQCRFRALALRDVARDLRSADDAAIAILDGRDRQ